MSGESRPALVPAAVRRREVKPCRRALPSSVLSGNIKLSDVKKLSPGMTETPEKSPSEPPKRADRREGDESIEFASSAHAVPSHVA